MFLMSQKNIKYLIILKILNIFNKNSDKILKKIEILMIK